MSDTSGTRWFVRIRTATRFTLNPGSWQGWAVTLGYGLVVLAIWLGMGQLRPRGLHVFATVGAVAATLAASVVLVTIALRTSSPTAGGTTGDSGLRPVTAHVTLEPGYWFVRKMFGIGATPVTWQGWALTLGFAVLLVLDIRFLHERIAQIGVGVSLVAAFTVIAIRKTKGGWGWHWGPRP